jgi:AcrR family transcriptional regulator
MVNTSASPNLSTEEKILEAAKKVFVERGMDGTTMQQIADEAQINKSLLHYYYRTKEKLFGTVLKFAFKFVVPQLKEIMGSKDDIFTKIEKIVSGYIDLLMKNKFIPAFIFHEINRNPQVIVQVMKDAGVNPELFIDQFKEEIRKGTIRNIDPRHLILNLISLCIFPIIARPLAQRLFFNNNDEHYERFLEERKKAVADFIIHSIKV